MLLLEIPFGPVEIALLAGLAVVWAAYGLLAALLKAQGRADLSGVVANVLWPLGPDARARRGGASSAGGELAGDRRGERCWPRSCRWRAAVAASPERRRRRGGRHSVRGPVRPGGLRCRWPATRWARPRSRRCTRWSSGCRCLLGGVLGPGAGGQAAGLFAASRTRGAVQLGLPGRADGAGAADRRRPGAHGDAPAARRVLCGRSRWRASRSTWPLCLVGSAAGRPGCWTIFDSSYDSWAGGARAAHRRPRDRRRHRARLERRCSWAGAPGWT